MLLVEPQIVQRAACFVLLLAYHFKHAFSLSKIRRIRRFKHQTPPPFKSMHLAARAISGY